MSSIVVSEIFSLITLRPSESNSREPVILRTWLLASAEKDLRRGLFLVVNCCKPELDLMSVYL